MSMSVLLGMVVAITTATIQLEATTAPVTMVSVSVVMNTPVQVYI